MDEKFNRRFMSFCNSLDAGNYIDKILSKIISKMEEYA